jgi:hypothetical protein
MLPRGTKLFVHVYESNTFKKMVEIKKIGTQIIYLIFLEYATWQHEIGHCKLVTSCMIVA